MVYFKSLERLAAMQKAKVIESVSSQRCRYAESSKRLWYDFEEAFTRSCQTPSIARDDKSCAHGLIMWW